ncbi:MAG: ATP-binding cassette domain-containing protein [Chloroflexota bacterium]
MAQTVVEATDLTKVYGDDFTAVNGLNLKIDEGEVFGFLGPNGAGKTTTLLMLLGLTEPTSGTVQVCGMDPARNPIKVKHLVGYMPERIGFYEDLTAKQNLRYTADLNSIPVKETEERISSLLETVGLSRVGDHPVRTFSRGMKQRLGIADIWLKEPQLAFLDEPTTGLDPNGVDELLKLVSEMGKKGITVIFCSHILPQVQRVCSRVGIIAKGNLVADGPIEKLGRDAGRYRMEAEVDDASDKVVKAVRKVPGVQEVEIEGTTLVVSAGKDLRGQVSRAIIDSGAQLLGMRIQELNLEKIFKRYSREAQ